VFRAGRKLEEKGLRAREADGRNDACTNASESGAVFRSCSYANVGFFWVRSPMRTTRTGRQI
jgi:hypothetical protein